MSTRKHHTEPGADDVGRAVREFSLTDRHGIELFAYEWATEDPVAVVQIAHGVGEYALRYDAFARALVDAGFTVYADDHRGHGKTGTTQWTGQPTKLGKLGPGGLRAAEEGMLQLTAHIREQHSGLPVIMFGHSWGSLMAQRIINRVPRAYDGVILSGTAFRTPTAMESGALNKKWQVDGATGFEWLSRDPEIARAFAADPLCFEADILKLFGVADGLRLYGKPSGKVAADVPILIVSGGEDPLHRGEANLQTLAAAFRTAGVREVSVKIYPGARHEILNETNREQVTQDLITWLLERFGADE